MSTTAIRITNKYHCILPHWTADTLLTDRGTSLNVNVTFLYIANGVVSYAVTTTTTITISITTTTTATTTYSMTSITTSAMSSTTSTTTTTTTT